MKTDILLQEVQKIPEIEMEVIWYLNEYKSFHPWEKVVDGVYVDFNIAFPQAMDTISKKLLIGFSILLNDYEIEEDDLPGAYRIYIENIGYLDDLKDVSTFIIHSLGNLIEHYYQANEKNIFEKFDNNLALKILKWNCSTYVKQEEVRALIDTHTLADTAKKAKVKVDFVSEILSDYYVRINKKKFENLERFFIKVEMLFEANANLKENTTYLNYIMEQIKNGGTDLNSSDKLFPHFKGIQLN
jgi:hypothetical protein